MRAEAKAPSWPPTRARRPTTPTTSSSRSSCDHLPHGLIGLLVAAFFAAALSSKAAELNALGSTTTVDFYRHVVRAPRPTTRTTCAASQWFTVVWGLVAIGFALFANLAENLIQAVNIVGSIFYGVVLGALPGGVLPAAGRRHRRLLGGAGGAGPGVRALLLP